RGILEPGAPVAADLWCLKGVFQGRLNTSLEVNGKHPFRILAQRHDRTHNTLTEYRSENLWTDPQPFLSDGQALRVFVDPQRAARYSMDLSFLPTLHS
ncbi:hypothetical protein M3O48_17650, partial [Xanthomonas nasturtii]|nr:hypothetical protein [Xanthomonas nasturtii]